MSSFIPTEEQINAYPVRDWRYEVNNGDTRLGYNEWLSHRVESNAPPSPKHTPGPWVAIGRKVECEIRTAVYLGPICEAFGRDELESEANATLIAAAPEMRKAIMDLLNCCELNMDDMELDTLHLLEQVGTVLSKANGVNQ